MQRVRRSTVSSRTFEDVKANAAELIDVGMIEFRHETHLGWRHGIFFWQEQFHFEFATFVRTLKRGSNGRRQCWQR